LTDTGVIFLMKDSLSKHHPRRRTQDMSFAIAWSESAC